MWYQALLEWTKRLEDTAVIARGKEWLGEEINKMKVNVDVRYIKLNRNDIR